MTTRTLSQVDSRLTTEITTRAGQLAGTTSSVLRDRIAALEAKQFTEAEMTAIRAVIAASGGSGGVPTAPEPPGTGGGGTVTPGPSPVVASYAGDGPGLVNLMKNDSLDEILVTSATPAWQAKIRQRSLVAQSVDVNRTRPIKIRFATGVVLDGAGLSNGLGPFHLNTLVGSGSAPADFLTDVTIDFAGATMQGYALGQDAMVMVGSAKRIALLNPKIRTSTGITNGSAGVYNQSHAFYIEDGGLGAPAEDISIVDADVASNGTINGVQTFHNPTVADLTVLRGKWANLWHFLLLYGDASGILVDGAQVANVLAVVDADNTGSNHAAGTIRNVHSTGSPAWSYGAGLWKAPLLVDGGGNVVG